MAMRSFLLSAAEGWIAAMISFFIGWLIGDRRSFEEMLIGSLIFVCVYVVVRPFISRLFRRTENA